MLNKTFSWKERGNSFRYALVGLRSVLRSEHNMWLHFAATIGVIVLSVAYHITRTEILILVFSIGLVWIAELFNTCIEKTMDFITTQYHPKIKIIKDLAAGAVLIAAMAAFIIGCIIFLPKIFPG